MAMRIEIRDAVLDEIPQLEALQLRASVVAPDYREALAAHPEVIHLPATDVSEGRTRVAMVDGRVAGFSVVLAVHGTACELDGLFVEPDLMRTGIGGALIADVVDRARTLGVRRIDVIANPTAVDFYNKVGFERGKDAMTQFGPASWMHLDLPWQEGQWSANGGGVLSDTERARRRRSRTRRPPPRGTELATPPG